MGLIISRYNVNTWNSYLSPSVVGIQIYFHSIIMDCMKLKWMIYKFYYAHSLILFSQFKHVSSKVFNVSHAFKMCSGSRLFVKKWNLLRVVVKRFYFYRIINMPIMCEQRSRILRSSGLRLLIIGMSSLFKSRVMLCKLQNIARNYFTHENERLFLTLAHT